MQEKNISQLQQNKDSLNNLYHFRIKNAPPSVKLYLEFKRENPDCILFFGIGEFYEIFFEDAEKVSAEINLAISHRGKICDEDIPMCGVPKGSLETHVSRLVNLGYKVAICDQLDEQGSDKCLKREISRIITPGTVIDADLLKDKTSSFLASVVYGGDKSSIVWADVSTGECHYETCDTVSLEGMINAISPREILLSPDNVLREQLKFIIAQQDVAVTEFQSIDCMGAKSIIKQSFSDEEIFKKTLSNATELEIRALGTLIGYLRYTQKGDHFKLNIPQKNLEYMEIDASSQKNLEIYKRSDGSKKDSLLDIIDRTTTAGGSRMLRASLQRPLLSVEKIKKRQEKVEFFVNNKVFRDQLRNILKSIPDTERCVSRICSGKSRLNDILQIREALRYSEIIISALSGENSASLKVTSELLKASPLKAEKLCFRSFQHLVTELDKAIDDSQIGSLHEGGYIKSRYHSPLDELRISVNQSRGQIKRLEAKYARETDIAKLKIKFTSTLGYFIEIASKDEKKAGKNFIYRRSLSGVIRYSTEELSELADNIAGLKFRIIALERELFDKLIAKIAEMRNDILLAARVISALDFYSSLADLAETESYCKPDIDDSTEIDIKEARHPVLEKTVLEQSMVSDSKAYRKFIANDCMLNKSKNIWIITGPNMAGKSTFLRQNAIIIIMAQIGSYIPASSARIGITDKLFGRIGASDDLARGVSTFMVEMIETANILHKVTDKSFIILDEIGRGTSTHDGLSIAQSVIEYISKRKNCRTLFATHYHELADLDDKLKDVASYTTEISNINGRMRFLYKIILGKADKSYGIHVAGLAGMPKEVIDRAERILRDLDNDTDDIKNEKQSDMLATVD